jgi:nucleolin
LTKSTESTEPADGETGYIQSAIDSASEAAESVSTYAGEAAQSLTRNYEQAKDTAVEVGTAAAAATGFTVGREQRRTPDNFNSRAGPADRVLTPTSGIYVGNLLFDVTAADLTKEFQEFGPIKNVTVAADARGLSKG